MKISVVIPAFNEAGMIEACLESLRLQSRKADEIIVVDNNSTDDTAKIARKHGAEVINEPVQGISAASHTGMNAARGDIIARCDADSILPNNWLAHIEDMFTVNEAIDAVTGPGVFYDTDRLTAWLAQIWYMYSYFVLVGSALANWPLFGSNYAIRRGSWLGITDEVHRDRADIHDDIDVSMHLPLGSKVILSRNIKVGISARALKRSGLRKRYERGFRSLVIHWRDRSPYVCWKNRLLSWLQ